MDERLRASGIGRTDKAKSPEITDLGALGLAACSPIKIDFDFDGPAGGPSQLGRPMMQLLADRANSSAHGTGPHRLGMLRCGLALRSDALECELAQLYVVPARRGKSLGRALMEAALDTGEDDVC
jgi:GNAT superfamily N-acetyltransferase